MFQYYFEFQVTHLNKEINYVNHSQQDILSLANKVNGK